MGSVDRFFERISGKLDEENAIYFQMGGPSAGSPPHVNHGYKLWSTSYVDHLHFAFNLTRPCLHRSHSFAVTKKESEALKKEKESWGHTL